MLNDFKILSFDKVTHKLQRLKDIFNRLTLSPFEDRLKKLSSNFDVINTLVVNLSKEISEKQEENPKWPEPPTPPEPPEPELLPDLAITSVVPITHDNYIDLIVTVTNVGTVLSPSTYLRTLIPDLMNQDIYVPSLANGESFITRVQQSYDPDGEEKLTTFLTEVNPNRTFDEITYSNNSSSISITIKSQWPIDSNTYLIFHTHNLEGLEIGSYAPFVTVKIGLYNFTSSTNINNHGTRVLFNYPGIYNCQAIFNGITVDLGDVEILQYSTTVLIFNFPRIEASLNFNSECLKAYAETVTIEQPNNWQPFVRTDNNSKDGFNIHTDFFGYDPSGLGGVEGTVSTRTYSSVLLTPTLYLANIFTELSGQLSYAIGTVYEEIYGKILSPIDEILPNTFTNWYCQSFLTGNYPRLNLNSEFGNKHWLTSENKNVWYTNTIPANIKYVNYETYLYHKLLSGQTTHFWQHSPSIIVDDSQHNEGTAIIKIVSVPYDVNNIGW